MLKDQWVLIFMKANVGRLKQNTERKDLLKLQNTLRDSFLTDSQEPVELLKYIKQILIFHV